MVSATFWNWWLCQHLHDFVHSLIFSTPPMEYCYFWCLKITRWASMPARCICRNERSYARSFQNMEIVIPMLGRKHIFCDPHARWECHFCFFQHLCGENAWKTGFLKISKWFVHFLILCCSWALHVAALFLTTCKNVHPTLRGDHVLDFMFPPLCCCDVKALCRLAHMCFPPSVGVTFLTMTFSMWFVAKWISMERLLPVSWLHENVLSSRDWAGKLGMGCDNTR